MDTFMSLTNVVLEHCLAVVSSDTSLQSNELESENTLSFHSDSENREDVGNGNLRLQLGHQYYCEENQNNGIAAGSRSKKLSITKIDSLSIKILDIIFSYLNPSDLIHSRFVCRHWNAQICQNSKFLSSIVLQVNEHSLPVLASSSVSWENISVCKIDFATTRATVTTRRAKIKPKTRIPSPVPQQPPPSYSEATSNSNNSSTPNPVISLSPSHIGPPEDKIEIKTENETPPSLHLQSPLEVEVDWSKTQHFLGHAKYLDFRCSILTWGTIQTFLSWTKALEHLSFDRCTLLSPVSAPIPAQIKQPKQTRHKSEKQSNAAVTEKACNEALKTLNTLTIQDIGAVDKMLQILIKLVAKKLTNLERIYVVFDSNMNNFINPGNNTSQIVSTVAVGVTTSTTATTLEQANVFHYQILQLMFENRKSIRCLYLNLRDRILMSTFCGQVLDNFDVTISHLEEFQLTPYLAEYSDDSLDSDVDVIASAGVSSAASMTSSYSQSSASSASDGNSYISNSSTAPMFTLMNFLNRHPTLKHVSFPHFNSRSSNDFRRRRMFRSLPKAVEKLNLPGYSYLVPDFLSQLPKLKSIFMGSIPGKPFHPNSYRYAPHVCQFIEEVGVSTRIHLRPGKLVNFAWKFPKLTKLEFDAMRSVVNDLDLQGIILNCTSLRYLSIFGCDLITDFGVTGSSLELCKEMFRLGVIYSHPESEIPRRSKYKPITTLKGLRTLILRGNSKITDVGIFYGFRFQELKHLWIPYSERITGWGLKQLGSWNPSLEALGVTAVNVAHTEALNDLMEKHPRISSDRILVQSWHDESPSIMSSPSMLTSLIDD